MQSAVPRSQTSFLVLLPLLLLIFSSSAFATLGEKVTSVQADQADMKGSLRITQSAAYSVHEIKAEPGVAVREYASPDGTVFGIAWQGPGHPDMRQLLGSYFDQYSQAVRMRTSRRGPLLIQQPGLVIELTGHARSFAGRVYIPQIVPQGVGTETIK